VAAAVLLALAAMEAEEAPEQQEPLTQVAAVVLFLEQARLLLVVPVSS
jgi:hypothetical protein